MKCYNILEYNNKKYFTNLYIYSYDFNNEIIIRKYIYIEEDTNTYESLKNLFDEKNIL